MSRDAPNPPSLAVWQAQYLRLIGFPDQPQNSVQQNWWHDLTGIDPETRVRRRLEVEEEGVFEGNSFSLSIDLLRLQWTLAPRMSPDNLPQGPPTLGSFIEHKERFRFHMHNWLAMSPPVKRLAFTGVLVQPVESREAGYDLLNCYLRCVDIDRESRDILYRINRPVRSETDVPNLYINRLSTWSVAMFTLVIREQLVGMAGQEAGHQVAMDSKFACLLELDINTVPEPPDRILPRESLPRILDELINLGTALATVGDAPL
jgi:hypothetical protein